VSKLNNYEITIRQIKLIKFYISSEVESKAKQRVKSVNRDLLYGNDLINEEIHILKCEKVS